MVALIKFQIADMTYMAYGVSKYTTVLYSVYWGDFFDEPDPLTSNLRPVRSSFDASKKSPKYYTVHSTRYTTKATFLVRQNITLKVSTYTVVLKNDLFQGLIHQKSLLWGEYFLCVWPKPKTSFIIIRSFIVDKRAIRSRRSFVISNLSESLTVALL